MPAQRDAAQQRERSERLLLRRDADEAPECPPTLVDSFITNPEGPMRFYTKAHRFFCGIDLHARTMAICIVDDHLLGAGAQHLSERVLSGTWT